MKTRLERPLNYLELLFINGLVLLFIGFRIPSMSVDGQYFSIAFFIALVAIGINLEKHNYLLLIVFKKYYKNLIYRCSLMMWLTDLGTHCCSRFLRKKA